MRSLHLAPLLALVAPALSQDPPAVLTQSTWGAVSLAGNLAAVAGFSSDGDGTVALRLFQQNISGWVEVTGAAGLKPDGETRLGKFGRSVSLANASGVWTVAVGAPATYRSTGACHVLSLQGSPPAVGPWMGTWSKLSPVDAQDDDQFGTSVSLSGTTLAVGAPTSAMTGAVYLFTFSAGPSGGLWEQAAKILPVDQINGSDFGRSLSLAGDILVVGAPNAVANEYGIVFAYTRLPNQPWIHYFGGALPVPPQIKTYGLGISVSISADGNVIAAGAPETGLGVQGSILLFTKQSASYAFSVQLQRPATYPSTGLFGKFLSLSEDGLALAVGDVRSISIYESKDINWTNISSGDLGPVTTGETQGLSLTRSSLLASVAQGDAGQVLLWSAFQPPYTTTTTSTSPGKTTTAAPSGSGGLSGGMKALIGVLVVLGAGGLGGIAYRAMARRPADGAGAALRPQAELGGQRNRP